MDIFNKRKTIQLLDGVERPSSGSTYRRCDAFRGGGMVQQRSGPYLPKSDYEDFRLTVCLRVKSR